MLRTLLPACGAEFSAYRDDQYFTKSGRDAYFESIPLVDLAHATVFFDPDIGLETGTAAYMQNAGAEKYVRYDDLAHVFKRSTDSILVVYQHLQRDATKRDGDVQRRLIELEARVGASWSSAIRFDDVAFLAFGGDAAVGVRAFIAMSTHAGRHGGFVHIRDAESPVFRPSPSAESHARGHIPLSTMPPPVRSVNTSPRIGGPPSLTLEEVIQFLNAAQIRATYRAVASLVGGIPQGIGQRLGARRREASWVVSAAACRLVTPPRIAIRHCCRDIIATGDDLRRRYQQWKERTR